MCLKFLLESNPENQALVSSLESRKVATDDAMTQEVIDTMNLNFQFDKDGKLQLSKEDMAVFKAVQAEALRKPMKVSNSNRENGRIVPITEGAGAASTTDKGKGKDKSTDDDLEFM